MAQIKLKQYKGMKELQVVKNGNLIYDKLSATWQEATTLEKSGWIKLGNYIHSYYYHKNGSTHEQYTNYLRALSNLPFKPNKIKITYYGNSTNSSYTSYIGVGLYGTGRSIEILSHSGIGAWTIGERTIEVDVSSLTSLNYLTMGASNGGGKIGAYTHLYVKDIWFIK